MRRQQDRTENHRQSGWKRLGHRFGDWLIRIPGLPQVTDDRAGEPLTVLDKNGLVEPEFGALGLDLIDGRDGTEDLAGRVLPGQAEQEECGRGHDEEQHDARAEPAQDEEQHRQLLRGGMDGETGVDVAMRADPRQLHFAGVKFQIGGTVENFCGAMLMSELASEHVVRLDVRGEPGLVHDVLVQLPEGCGLLVSGLPLRLVDQRHDRRIGDVEGVPQCLRGERESERSPTGAVC